MTIEERPLLRRGVMFVKIMALAVIMNVIYPAFFEK